MTALSNCVGIDNHDMSKKLVLKQFLSISCHIKRISKVSNYYFL